VGAYEALRAALSKWLSKQAQDVVRLAERVLGVRSGDSLTRLVTELDVYYADLSRVMPADQKTAIEGIARTAMDRVTASVGPDSGVTEGWLSGYLNGYYGNANERLCSTCQKQVERYIAGADGDAVSALRSKLGDWGDKRAEVMARHEASMALNKTLVAGFYRAGYSAVWKAPPGSCKICTLLHDQPVTTLTPPLHKGCACTVDKGEKIQTLSDAEKYANMKAYLESAGMYGSLNIPAKQINGVDGFRFDAEHSMKKHEATEADARAFIAESRISLSRHFKGSGWWECYYGERGAAYVLPGEQVIRTAFPEADFDPRTRALVREMVRLGL